MILEYFKRTEYQCIFKEEPTKKGCSWIVYVNPEALCSIAQGLLEHNFFLEDISALDVKEGIMIVYVFNSMVKTERISLRFLVPHDAPVVPSITSIYTGAEWHERECTDFYCIKFEGNPNPVPLLLPPGMDHGPLKKAEENKRSIHDIFGASTGEMVIKKESFILFEFPENIESREG